MLRAEAWAAGPASEDMHRKGPSEVTERTMACPIGWGSGTATGQSVSHGSPENRADRT